jgi:hypothetical protein
VKNRLENGSKFETLEINDDVAGLLEELRDEILYRRCAARVLDTPGTIRRPTAINQGPDEAVANHHKRFLLLPKLWKRSRHSAH